MVGWGPLEVKKFGFWSVIGFRLRAWEGDGGGLLFWNVFVFSLVNVVACPPPILWLVNLGLRSKRTLAASSCICFKVGLVGLVWLFGNPPRGS